MRDSFTAPISPAINSPLHRHRLNAWRWMGYGFLSLGLVAAVSWAWNHATEIHLEWANCTPCWGSVLGRDALGRDLLARLVQGASVSAVVGIAAAAIDLCIGTLVGAVCLLHWRVDRLILALLDVAYGLPYLVVAAVLSSWSSSSWLGTLLALVVVGWIPAARLMRGHLLALAAHESVLTARMLRLPLHRLVVTYLLPSCKTVMLTHLAVAIPQAILTESLLSYLGLGIRPPLASLGSLCQEGLLFAWQAPWMAWPPICMLVGLQLLTTRASRGAAMPSNFRNRP
jgi:oligopeptide transport system permease protein